MRPSFILIFIGFIATSIFGQPAPTHSIVRVDDGLYHLYYDSSTAKSTIVEFEKFIVLLEVPTKNEGGGATNLKDHVYAGKKVLDILAKEFPKKPLKYILHTHWHPHSLSSIKPFITNGATIITTQSNWKKIRTFTDTLTLDKYKKNIQIVDKDSIVIKDKMNKIVAYRFLQKDFPNTPTPEYLYFYLPRYSALHTGCMYNRWQGDPVEGREILTGREEDIQKFLVTKNIKPQCFLRGSGDKNEEKGMIAFAKFDNVIHNGISATEINKKYVQIPEPILRLKKDSLIHVIKSNKIPKSFYNSAAYSALRGKLFDVALDYAQIHLALDPEDPNGWDTLGEVYYFMNQVELARLQEKMARKVSPDFSQGGEKAWKENLENMKKTWGK
jgi:hypothetical protein